MAVTVRIMAFVQVPEMSTQARTVAVAAGAAARTRTSSITTTVTKRGSVLEVLNVQCHCHGRTIIRIM